MSESLKLRKKLKAELPVYVVEDHNEVIIVNLTLEREISFALGMEFNIAEA